jgi:xylulokinase
MRYILAHDLGTTGNKATLYDEHGHLVKSSFIPYPTAYPHTGWAEQDPQDWWRSFCVSTKGLLQEAHVPAREIACVVFSGQMMGMVPVDAQARPVHDAIIWADQRSVAQVERVAQRIDPHRVYAITGHRLSASYSAGKMLWLQENKPEAYERTYKFLQAKDFLIARLTGVFATD